MTPSNEPYRALLDGIAVASTVADLAELRAAWRRERRDDGEGGFVELLIDVRQAKLTRQANDSPEEVTRGEVPPSD